MPQTYNPTGTIGTALTEATVAEAGTGTNGQTFMKDNLETIGNKIRFLADTGSSGETAWTAPSLLNSWVNLGGASQTAGYYLDLVTGRVWLRGEIKSGTTTVDTTLFVLASGYRPTATEKFVTVSNLAVAGVYVDTSGNVKILFGASATSLALNGISFRIT